jgi:hypothetical protein
MESVALAPAAPSPIAPSSSASVAQARAALDACRSTIERLKQKSDDLQRLKVNAVASRGAFETAAIARLISGGDEPLPEATAPPPPPGLDAALGRLSAQLREAREHEDACRAVLRAALADCALARRAAIVADYRRALDRLRGALTELWAADLLCSKVAESAIAPHTLTTFSMRDVTRGSTQAFTVDSLRRDAAERAPQLAAEIASACGESSLPF